MSGQRPPMDLVARVAGLPCDVVSGFSSRLLEPLAALSRAHEGLDAARAGLLDRLHEAVRDAGTRERPVLLSVKRDCYNGRRLRPHLDTGAWRVVEQVAASSAARLLDLESDVETASRSFDIAYADEVRRQHAHLVSLLDDPTLRTGLAMASPLVGATARRLHESGPDGYGRRELRLVRTLLRYVSRAALKLSPFATFTPVGLARVAPGDERLALVGGAWERRSLVRLRRYVLDRCADLLMAYPPWRDRLGVTLNDSAVTMGDRRVLLRRPSRYRPDEQSGTLTYHEEALVRLGRRGPLVECLSGLLRHGAVTYAELLPVLRDRIGPGATEAELAEQVDRLVDVGFLHLAAPWSSDDPWLETTMLRELKKLPADARLQTFIDRLDRLIKLQQGLMDAGEPASSVLEMEQLVDGMIRQAAALGGISPRVDVTTRGDARDLYQDVWCAPPRKTLVRVGRSALDQAVRSVEPLVRYARLWDRRLEFLYTLSARLRGTRGEDDRVPVLEAFQAVQPLWQEFMTFQVQRRSDDDASRRTWNPLGLSRLSELASWRAAAQAALTDSLVDGPEGRRVTADGLDAALGQAPPRFTDFHVGGCLFLQPASRDGSLWMLNRLKEGTGRYSSRYTPVMPPALARRYTAALRRRGAVEVDGERVELLDVHCIQGDTLNVHAPQTPKVLTLPGTNIDLPPRRRVTLGDLRVTFGEEGWPQLRDRAGHRYLPVYLGLAYHDYLPTLVKFLCAFGPTELGAVFPERLTRERDGLLVQERTVIGNVVLQRRGWRVPAADLRRLLGTAGEAAAFIQLHRWRERHGLPERLFVVEHVPHASLDSLYKPQYLDLTSPLFVSLLRTIVEGSDETLLFQEALPAPEVFPEDAEGRRWAVELLVDSLALQPAGRYRRRGASGEVRDARGRDGPHAATYG